MVWLRKELFRVKGFSVRRLHGVGLLAVIALVAVLSFGLGLLTGRNFPYHTLPAPPVPKGQVTPDCGAVTHHTLGECLPQPKGATPATGAKHAAVDVAVLAAYTTGITGSDLSNNDPVPCAQFAAVAAHTRFVYLKSVEGTGFYDGTAANMARCAKARGLPVGGYDFQHVCGNDASSEAAFFVRALRAQGLLGPGTLPPAADSEYGSGSCGGRGWLQTWVNTVYNLDGHVCPITYTGAWWWQPNVGDFWPTCQNKQLLTWISGYAVSYPYMPSGVSHLDFWQFTDHGYNGSSVYGDLSAWQHGNASFVAFAHGVVPKPKPKPDPYRILAKQPSRLKDGSSLSEYATVKAWDQHRCHNTDRRGTCGRLRAHMLLLRANVYRAANTEPSGPVGFRPGLPSWGVRHRGIRFQILTHRVH